LSTCVRDVVKGETVKPKYTIGLGQS
jgi:hypothetical protein